VERMTCLTTHPLSINPSFWLYMFKGFTLPISMYYIAQQLLFCGICSQLIPESVSWLLWIKLVWYRTLNPKRANLNGTVNLSFDV